MGKHRNAIPGQKNYLKETEMDKIGSNSIEQTLKRLNISSLEHTFEKYKTNQGNIEAVKTMKSLSSGESKLKFVLLYGKTGSGKTHLIEALIIDMARYSKHTRYFTFSEIARILKRQLRLGGDYYETVFKSYCDMSYLIIDDFGMGTTESRFEISDLEDIIDIRYRRRNYPSCQGNFTILATNKDLKELPDRVLSRFYDPEYGAVVFTGEKDYRRRGKV